MPNFTAPPGTIYDASLLRQSITYTFEHILVQESGSGKHSHLKLPCQILPIPPIPPIPPFSHPPKTVQSVGRGSLAETLLLTTSAATNRIEEATLMFQKIVAVLDDALKEIVLPQHLQRNFREFITDLNAVARQHFESHVRGTSRPFISHSVTSTINPSATTPQSKNKTQIDSAPKNMRPTQMQQRAKSKNKYLYQVGHRDRQQHNH